MQDSQTLFLGTTISPHPTNNKHKVSLQISNVNLPLRLPILSYFLVEEGF